jgi:aminopeptidase N
MEAGRARILSAEETNRPVIDPEVTDLFALLNSNNYPKGGWVLHMLRGLIGDEGFFRGVRDYYRANRHTAVLTSDFQKAMETAAGRDLGWFFGQWLYRPGYPVFDVSEAWAPADQGGEMAVTVRQVQKAEWPRFRVPLQMCWGDGPARDCRPATAGSATDTFRFRFAARPASPVTIDPDGWVLKEVVARP